MHVFGAPTKIAHCSANTAMLRADTVPIRMSRSHAPQLARYHDRFKRFWSKICTYCTRIAEKNGWCAVQGQIRPNTAENDKSLIQRVRLANADVNRSQVWPEHVSGGGASVLDQHAYQSRLAVPRTPWLLQLLPTSRTATGLGARVKRRVFGRGVLWT